MSKKLTSKMQTPGAVRAPAKGSRRSRQSDAPPSLSTGALFQDWSEFLRLLTLHRVRFLLVGGHALAVHSRPRHTEDLDLFVDATVVRSEVRKWGYRGSPGLLRIQAATTDTRWRLASHNVWSSRTNERYGTVA